MSPKFYSFLWALFFASAGVMWLAGALSMIAIVVFGFVAFGMVFMGMMCVLPSAVSHPAPKEAKILVPKMAVKPTYKKQANRASVVSSVRPV